MLNGKNQEQAKHDSTCLLEQEIARLTLHLREYVHYSNNVDFDPSIGLTAFSSVFVDLYLDNVLLRLLFFFRVEESRQEILEERYKWKCAYEELVEENENRKASVEKLVTAGSDLGSALVDPESVTSCQVKHYFVINNWCLFFFIVCLF